MRLDLDQIKSKKGRLYILFANAGTAKYAKLGEITEELFDLIFEIGAQAEGR